jgi:hypothetical protein
MPRGALPTHPSWDGGRAIVIRRAPGWRRSRNRRCCADNGTPTFYINGRRHDAAFDFETLSAALEHAIEIADSSRAPSKVS